MEEKSISRLWMIKKLKFFRFLFFVFLFADFLSFLFLGVLPFFVFFGLTVFVFALADSVKLSLDYPSPPGP